MIMNIQPTQQTQQPLITTTPVSQSNAPIITRSKRSASTPPEDEPTSKKAKAISPNSNDDINTIKTQLFSTYSLNQKDNEQKLSEGLAKCEEYLQYKQYEQVLQLIASASQFYQYMQMVKGIDCTQDAIFLIFIKLSYLKCKCLIGNYENEIQGKLENDDQIIDDLFSEIYQISAPAYALSINKYNECLERAQSAKNVLYIREFSALVNELSLINQIYNPQNLPSIKKRSTNAKRRKKSNNGESKTFTPPSRTSYSKRENDQKAIILISNCQNYKNNNDIINLEQSASEGFNLKGIAINSKRYFFNVLFEIYIENDLNKAEKLIQAMGLCVKTYIVKCNNSEIYLEFIMKNVCFLIKKEESKMAIRLIKVTINEFNDIDSDLMGKLYLFQANAYLKIKINLKDKFKNELAITSLKAGLALKNISTVLREELTQLLKDITSNPMQSIPPFQDPLLLVTQYPLVPMTVTPNNSTIEPGDEFFNF